MSRKYKFRDNEEIYFVSFATVHWVDVFTRAFYKDILVESLQFCQQNKGLELYAWCIMTNHVHLIIGSREQPLWAIMRDLKKFTAIRLLEAIKDNPQESRKEWLLWFFGHAGRKNPNNKNYQFWQQDSHPIVLDRAEIAQQKLDYLHANPVAAGQCCLVKHFLLLLPQLGEGWDGVLTNQKFLTKQH